MPWAVTRSGSSTVRGSTSIVASRRPRSLQRERGAAFDPTSRVATGIPGLDELLNGGYYVASTTLVVGISGAGKSVMALQFVAEGARRGERSLMITLDEPPGQVLRNAQSIGIDLQSLIDRRLAHLWYEPPQEFEIDRHFAQIEAIVEDFKPQRVVIDSLSTYGSSLGASERSFRDFFHAIVALMKERQITAVYNIILMNWVELGNTFRHAVVPLIPLRLSAWFKSRISALAEVAEAHRRGRRQWVPMYAVNLACPGGPIRRG